MQPTLVAARRLCVSHAVHFLILQHPGAESGGIRTDNAHITLLPPLRLQVELWGKNLAGQTISDHYGGQRCRT